MALRRAVELSSATKGERGAVAEKALAEQRKYAEELFETLGKLKGIALKAGQMASYVDGVIPAEFAPVYQEVLARLQSAAPSLPADACRRVIEADLGKPIDELFARFDDVPLAAASIGQVHQGELEDGTPVAIKVQYPDVDRAFESDLSNFKLLETMFGPLIRHYNSEQAVALARQNLLAELDYRRELDAQRRAGEIFAGDAEIMVPRVFEALSGDRVLTSALAVGRSFEEICRADQGERDHYGEVLVRYYLESMLVHHFVNPDPHPGNYVFHENGVVSLLDFGAAQEIDPVLCSGIGESLRAAIEMDEAGHRRAVHEVYGITDSEPTVFEAYCRIFWRLLDPWKPEMQPFAFTPEWIDSYLDMTIRESKQILTRGGWLPRLPPPVDFHSDIIFIERIAVGLGSILARLRARGDWSVLTRRVLERALPGGG